MSVRVRGGGEYYILPVTYLLFNYHSCIHHHSSEAKFGLESEVGSTLRYNQL